MLSSEDSISFQGTLVNQTRTINANEVLVYPSLPFFQALHVVGAGHSVTMPAYRAGVRLLFTNTNAFTLTVPAVGGTANWSSDGGVNVVLKGGGGNYAIPDDSMFQIWAAGGEWKIMGVAQAAIA